MNNIDITAKSTFYRDIRMRSRLEARWAIFLDVLHIQWVYEKEYFEVANELFYLPDFWLPDLYSWAEVKPCEFTVVETDKAKGLVSLTRKPLLKFVGMPPGDNLSGWRYKDGCAVLYEGASWTNLDCISEGLVKKAVEAARNAQFPE